MTTVREWRYMEYSSGVATIAESATSDPLALQLSACTLLRTRAFATVTAFATHDPYDLFSGHSQLVLQVVTYPNGTYPSGWPASLDDISAQVLEAPFQVVGSTVVPNALPTPTQYNVALHMAPQPGTIDSKAMRKFTADGYPLGQWYVGGANTFPQSGLDFALRIKVGFLFEYDI